MLEITNVNKKRGIERLGPLVINLVAWEFMCDLNSVK